MATEKRMIDPDKLSKATIEYCGSCFSLDELEKCGEIYVDAVEVVRCKDCKHKDGMPGQPNIVCWQMHDDDFCSYGERKDGDVDGSVHRS